MHFLIFNSVLLLSFSSFATDCHQSFIQTLKDRSVESFFPEKKYDFKLSPREKSKLVKIIEDGGPHRFNKAFDYYISVRLKSSSDQKKEAVHTVLSDFKIGVPSDPGGFYANTYEVIIPKDFHNSSILLAISAHEFEHMLQLSEIEQEKNEVVKKLKILLLVYSKFFTVLRTYETETQALLAQNEILSLLSEVEIEKMMNLVENSYLDDQYKQFFYKILDKPDSQNLEIGELRKIHGYNLGSIARDVGLRWTKLFVSLEAARILFHFLMIVL
ncbi:hypothetical protein N9O57_01395 [bacterium]|nr:hypothetical protein [bacterium]